MKLKFVVLASFLLHLSICVQSKFYTSERTSFLHKYIEESKKIDFGCPVPKIKCETGSKGGQCVQYKAECFSLDVSTKKSECISAGKKYCAREDECVQKDMPCVVIKKCPEETPFRCHDFSCAVDKQSCMDVSILPVVCAEGERMCFDGNCYDKLLYEKECSVTFDGCEPGMFQCNNTLDAGLCRKSTTECNREFACSKGEMMCGWERASDGSMYTSRRSAMRKRICKKQCFFTQTMKPETKAREVEANAPSDTVIDLLTNEKEGAVKRRSIRLRIKRGRLQHRTNFTFLDVPDSVRFSDKVKRKFGDRVKAPMITIEPSETVDSQSQPDGIQLEFPVLDEAAQQSPAVCRALLRKLRAYKIDDVMDATEDWVEMGPCGPATWTGEADCVCKTNVTHFSTFVVAEDDDLCANTPDGPCSVGQYLDSGVGVCKSCTLNKTSCGGGVGEEDCRCAEGGSFDGIYEGAPTCSCVQDAVSSEGDFSGFCKACPSANMTSPPEEDTCACKPAFFPSVKEGVVMVENAHGALGTTTTVGPTFDNNYYDNFAMNVVFLGSDADTVIFTETGKDSGPGIFKFTLSTDTVTTVAGGGTRGTSTGSSSSFMQIRGLCAKVDGSAVYVLDNNIDIRHVRISDGYSYRVNNYAPYQRPYSFGSTEYMHSCAQHEETTLFISTHASSRYLWKAKLSVDGSGIQSVDGYSSSWQKMLGGSSSYGIFGFAINRAGILYFVNSQDGDLYTSNVGGSSNSVPTLLAGCASSHYAKDSGDATCPDGSFYGKYGSAATLSTDEKYLYIAEGKYSNKIRRVNVQTGHVSMVQGDTDFLTVNTIAGNEYGNTGSADGAGTDASFHIPYDIAARPDAKSLFLIVSDSVNGKLRKISTGPYPEIVNVSFCALCSPHSSTRYPAHRPFTEPGTGDDCVCDPGYAKSTDGSCIACPKGMYRGEDSGDSCLPCPYGTTAETATTSVDGCLCSLLDPLLNVGDTCACNADTFPSQGLYERALENPYGNTEHHVIEHSNIKTWVDARRTELGLPSSSFYIAKHTMTRDGEYIYVIFHTQYNYASCKSCAYLFRQKNPFRESDTEFITKLSSASGDGGLYENEWTVSNIDPRDALYDVSVDGNYFYVRESGKFVLIDIKDVTQPSVKQICYTYAAEACSADHTTPPDRSSYGTAYHPMIVSHDGQFVYFLDNINSVFHVIIIKWNPNTEMFENYAKTPIKGGVSGTPDFTNSYRPRFFGVSPEQSVFYASKSQYSNGNYIYTLGMPTPSSEYVWPASPSQYNVFGSNPRMDVNYARSIHNRFYVLYGNMFGYFQMEPTRQFVTVEDFSPDDGMSVSESDDGQFVSVLMYSGTIKTYSVKTATVVESVALCESCPANATNAVSEDLLYTNTRDANDCECKSSHYPGIQEVAKTIPNPYGEEGGVQLIIARGQINQVTQLQAMTMSPDGSHFYIFNEWDGVYKITVENLAVVASAPASDSGTWDGFDHSSAVKITLNGEYLYSYGSRKLFRMKSDLTGSPLQKSFTFSFYWDVEPSGQFVVMLQPLSSSSVLQTDVHYVDGSNFNSLVTHTYSRKLTTLLIADSLNAYFWDEVDWGVYHFTPDVTSGSSPPALNLFSEMKEGDGSKYCSVYGASLSPSKNEMYITCYSSIIRIDMQSRIRRRIFSQSHYRFNGRGNGVFNPMDPHRIYVYSPVYNIYAVSLGPAVVSANASLCVACPPHSSTRYLGHRPYTETGKVEDCVCDLGYGKHADGSCIACEKGMYRDEDSGDSCLPCPYGTTETTASTSIHKCSCAWLGANFVLEPTQQQCVCDLGTEFVANVTVFTPVVWKVDQDLTQKRSCDTICGDVGMECNFEIEGFESGFESFDAFMELVAGDTGLVFEAQDYKNFGYSELFRPSVKYKTSYKSFYVADKYKVENIKTSSCDAAPSYNDEARICPCLRRYLQDLCLACPNGKFKNSLVEEKCSDCLFGTTNGTGAASALDCRCENSGVQYYLNESLQSCQCHHPYVQGDPGMYLSQAGQGNVLAPVSVDYTPLNAKSCELCPADTEFFRHAQECACKSGHYASFRDVGRKVVNINGPWGKVHDPSNFLRLDLGRAKYYSAYEKVPLVYISSEKAVYFIRPGYYSSHDRYYPTLERYKVDTKTIENVFTHSPAYFDSYQDINRDTRQSGQISNKPAWICGRDDPTQPVLYILSEGGRRFYKYDINANSWTYFDVHRTSKTHAQCKATDDGKYLVVISTTSTSSYVFGTYSAATSEKISSLPCNQGHADAYCGVYLIDLTTQSPSLTDIAPGSYAAGIAVTKSNVVYYVRYDDSSLYKWDISTNGPSKKVAGCGIDPYLHHDVDSGFPGCLEGSFQMEENYVFMVPDPSQKYLWFSTTNALRRVNIDESDSINYGKLETHSGYSTNIARQNLISASTAKSLSYSNGGYKCCYNVDGTEIRYYHVYGFIIMPEGSSGIIFPQRAIDAWTGVIPHVFSTGPTSVPYNVSTCLACPELSAVPTEMVQPYTVESSVSMCTCKAGYEDTMGACTPCSIKSYSNGSFGSTCQPCPTGSFSALHQGTKCEACLEHNYFGLYKEVLEPTPAISTAWTLERMYGSESNSLFWPEVGKPPQLITQYGSDITHASFNFAFYNPYCIFSPSDNNAMLCTSSIFQGIFKIDIALNTMSMFSGYHDRVDIFSPTCCNQFSEGIGTDAVFSIPGVLCADTLLADTIFVFTRGDNTHKSFRNYAATLNTKTTKLELFSNNMLQGDTPEKGVETCAINSAGDIFYSTYYELYRYYRRSGIVKKYAKEYTYSISSKSASITGLVMSPLDVLYFVTHYQIFIFHYRDEENIRLELITPLNVDAYGSNKDGDPETARTNTIARILLPPTHNVGNKLYFYTLTDYKLRSFDMDTKEIDTTPMSILDPNNFDLLTFDPFGQYMFASTKKVLYRTPVQANGVKKTMEYACMECEEVANPPFGGESPWACTCKSGRAFDFNGVCQDCVSGKYSPVTIDGERCNDCQCATCPSGKTSVAGSSSCTCFPELTDFDGASNLCAPCTDGTVSDLNSTCIPCPQGFSSHSIYTETKILENKWRYAVRKDFESCYSCNTDFILYPSWSYTCSDCPSADLPGIVHYGDLSEHPYCSANSIQTSVKHTVLDESNEEIKFEISNVRPRTEYEERCKEHHTISRLFQDKNVIQDRSDIQDILTLNVVDFGSEPKFTLEYSPTSYQSSEFEGSFEAKLGGMIQKVYYDEKFGGDVNIHFDRMKGNNIVMTEDKTLIGYARTNKYEIFNTLTSLRVADASFYYRDGYQRILLSAQKHTQFNGNDYYFVLYNSWGVAKLKVIEMGNTYDVAKPSLYPGIDMSSADANFASLDPTDTCFSWQQSDKYFIFRLTMGVNPITSSLVREYDATTDSDVWGSVFDTAKTALLSCDTLVTLQNNVLRRLYIGGSYSLLAGTSGDSGYYLDSNSNIVFKDCFYGTSTICFPDFNSIDVSIHVVGDWNIYVVDLQFKRVISYHTGFGNWKVIFLDTSRLNEHTKFLSVVKIYSDPEIAYIAMEDESIPQSENNRFAIYEVELTGLFAASQISTTTELAGHVGPWIKMELAHDVVVESVIVNSTDHKIQAWKFLGSFDGEENSWDILYEGSSDGVTASSSTIRTVKDDGNYRRFYALVITSFNADSDNFVSISAAGNMVLGIPLTGLKLAIKRRHGDIECVQCSSASYSSTEGSAICTACPVGMSSELSQGKLCTAFCDDGSQFNATDTTCTLCDPGKFSRKIDVHASGAVYPPYIHIPDSTLNSFVDESGFLLYDVYGERLRVKFGPGQTKNHLETNDRIIGDTFCKSSSVGDCAETNEGVHVDTAHMQDFNFPVQAGGVWYDTLECSEFDDKHPLTDACGKWILIDFMENVLINSLMANAVGYDTNHVANNYYWEPTMTNTYVEYTKNGLREWTWLASRDNVKWDILAEQKADLVLESTRETLADRHQHRAVLSGIHEYRFVKLFITKCATGNTGKCKLNKIEINIKKIPQQPSCKTCDENTFSNVSGATKCIDCIGFQREVTAGLDDCICKMHFFEEHAGGACRPCDDGQEMRERGVCSLCDVGKFSRYNANLSLPPNCTNCAPGTYANTTGLGECPLCKIGYFQPQSGQAECLRCDLNYYSDGDANGEGATGCLLCSPETSNARSYSTEQCMCGVSLYFNSTSQECEVCPEDKYCDGLSNKAKSCPVGTEAISAVCEACATGYYRNETTWHRCRFCPAGSTCADSSLAPQPCPPGKYSDAGQIACTACPEGYYADQAGSAECTECPLGTTCTDPTKKPVSTILFKMSVGITLAQFDQEARTKYRQGIANAANVDISAVVIVNVTEVESSGARRRLFSNDQTPGIVVDTLVTVQKIQKTDETLAGIQQNATQSVATSFAGLLDSVDISFSDAPEVDGVCQKGEYSVAGTVGCITCDPGYYADKTGSFNCSICPVGHQCQDPALSPTPCALGKFSDTLAAVSCATCARGYYADQFGTVTCQLCPAGSQCNDPATSPTPCSRGTYQPFNGTITCFNCSAGYYLNEIGSTGECIECEDGKTSQEASALCQVCPSGQYMANNTCVTCLTDSFCEFGLLNRCPAREWTRGLQGQGSRHSCKCQETLTRGRIETFQEQLQTFSEDPLDASTSPGYFKFNGEVGAYRLALDNSRFSAIRPELQLYQGLYYVFVYRSIHPLRVSLENRHGGGLFEWFSHGPNIWMYDDYNELCGGLDIEIAHSCAILKIPEAFTGRLYYYCDNHPNMLVGNITVKIPACVECDARTYCDGYSDNPTPCPDNTKSPIASNDITNCTCLPGFEAARDGIACTACLPGTYKELSGPIPCTECGYHTYNPAYASDSSDACLDCMPNSETEEVLGHETVHACMCISGFYHSSDTVCTECSPGTYNEHINRTTCTKCPAGTASNIDSADDVSLCKTCVPAKYAHPGSVFCTNCNLHATSAPGSKVLSDCKCNQGFFGNDGGHCTFCPRGTFKNVIGNSSCADCPSGKFSSTLNATSVDFCLECAPGKYSHAGLAECISCPSDSTSPESSRVVQDCECVAGFTGPNGGPCIKCEAGKFKTDVGNHSCSLCYPGKYSVAIGSTTNSSCKDCVAGTYSHAGASDCVTCPEHSTSPVASERIEACECVAGFTGPDAGPCTQCAIGKYKTDVGSHECTACPDNSTTTTLNNTDISGCVCMPRYTKSGSKCVFCAAGKYKNSVGNHTCTTCPLNSFSVAGSEHEHHCTCNPGHFKGGSTEFCTACAPSTYKEIQGNQACIACPSNSRSFVNGSVSFESCLCGPGFSGEFMDTGGIPVQALPILILQADSSTEEYERLTKLAKCHPCAQNLFKETFENSKCSQCKNNSASDEGSSGAEMCKCNPGYFGEAGLDCAKCEPGKFKDVAQHSSSCYDCPEYSSSLQYGTEASDQCECKTGHYGTSGEALGGDYCDSCEAGKYKSEPGNQQCSQCPMAKYTDVDMFGLTNVSQCLQCPDGLTSNPQSNGFGVTLSCIDSCKVGETGLAYIQCSVCVDGTYKSSKGSQACEPCPSYSSSVGDLYLDKQWCKCNPGRYGSATPTSAADCRGCEPGSYKNVSGAQNCTLCGKGKYNVAENSIFESSCVRCPAGKFLDGLGAKMASSCVECPPGTYQPILGATQFSDCIPCAKGKYSTAGPAQVYAEVCNDCERGKYLNFVGAAFQENCTACPTGTYATQTGNTDLSYCLKCPKGKFSVTESAFLPQFCIRCSYGKYSSTEGNGDPGLCLSCSPGKYSSILGATDRQNCSSCTPGTYSGSAFRACSTCEIGKINPHYEATHIDNCTYCPAGYQYLNISACAICKAGTYSQDEASRHSGLPCISCEPGTVSSRDGEHSISSCRECSPGTYANLAQAATVCLNCSRGYYLDLFKGVLHESCKPCPFSTYSNVLAATSLDTCIACPDDYSSMPASTNISDCLQICPPGKFGPNGDCQDCAEGKFTPTMGMSECLECPPESHSSAFKKGCVCNAGFVSDHEEGPTTYPLEPWLVGEDGRICTACGAGKFHDAAGGSTVCTNCHSGKYSTVVNASTVQVCLQCPAGKNSHAGTASIVGCKFLCERGFEGAFDRAFENCQKCPVGKFKNQNVGFCESCQALGDGLNSFDLYGVCGTCEGDSTHMSRRTSCYCGAGFEVSHYETENNSTKIHNTTFKMFASQDGLQWLHDANDMYESIEDIDGELIPNPTFNLFSGITYHFIWPVTSPLRKFVVAKNLIQSDKLVEVIIPNLFQEQEVWCQKSDENCYNVTTLFVSGNQFENEQQILRLGYRCPSTEISSMENRCGSINIYHEIRMHDLDFGTPPIRPVCTLCPPGKFKSLPLNTKCHSCPKGTFIETYGARNVLDCVRCQQGKFSSLKGRTVCETCPSGTFGIPDAFALSNLSSN